MFLFSDPAHRKGGQPFAIDGATWWLPRLSGYPKWFVVSGTSRDKARSPLLALFVETRAGSPWRLAAAVLLDRGARVPPIATDAQGYAIPVAPDAAGLALAPKAVAAAHASYLNAGLKGAPAAAFASDESARTLMEKFANDRRSFTFGTVSHRVEPAGGLTVALRTRQGGALVLYDERLRAEYVLTRPGGRISTGVWQALGAPDPVFNRLELVDLLQFATVVPARGAGRATPIANADALVDASGH
jgi:hypothetical protein